MTACGSIYQHGESNWKPHFVEEIALCVVEVSTLHAAGAFGEVILGNDFNQVYLHV